MLAMVALIPQPAIVPATGTPPKRISEFIGRVVTGTEELSIAVMESPTGWSEPGQRPEFDEYTIVLAGEILVETEHDALTVKAGQALHAAAGEWVRYSTPAKGGARYLSVCLPAFSPDTVHRDQGSR
jgi:quercetin dioxygenase-like cupin family protein